MALFTPTHFFAYNGNCERSELSSLFNGTDFSIYIFQAVRRAVNVLNVSTCIFFFFFFFFFNFHEIIDTMARKIKSYTHKKQTKKIQKLK